MSVIGGKQTFRNHPIMSVDDPGCGENSDVELARRKFVSITLNKKRTALAVTVERRKERKQFCAFCARARFHTAWTPNSDMSYPGASQIDQ